MNIDDVVVAVAHRGGLDAGDVRAGVRLGQRERGQQHLVDERREPLALLLLGPRDDHRPVAEPVRHDRRADPGAAPAELLADQHALEPAELEAPIGLRNVDVHQAELVRLGEHIRGVDRALVILAFLRPDLPLREVVGEVAQRLLLVGEPERDAAGGAFLECRHRLRVA
jgi:hypothetical protein